MEHATTTYCRFSGSVDELALALFGTSAVELLGGSPLSCAVPEAGCVVDVSIPTISGVNPARIRPRALIQHMARVLADSDCGLYAVQCAEMLPVFDGVEVLGGDAADELAAREASFFDTLCAQNDNASTIAHYLACHPFVAEVSYPGLKSDPCFDDAAQLLVHGFGNAVDYCLESDATFRRISVDEGDVFDQIEQLEQTLTALS